MKLKANTALGITEIDSFSAGDTIYSEEDFYSSLDYLSDNEQIYCETYNQRFIDKLKKEYGIK